MQRWLGFVGQFLLWILVCLALITLGIILWLRSTSEPQMIGKIKVPANYVQSSVDITRDQWGIPHIRAARDEDALFALGFVHWQDRAWQMDFQRRIVQGRLSEILGKEALPQDKFLRTWGFQRAAQTDLPTLTPLSKKIVAAYTAGVNAAMKQGKQALEFRLLGYQPEPWTEIDSISWVKMMSLDLARNYQQEIQGAKVVKTLGKDGLNQVFTPYPKEAPTILDDSEWEGQLSHQPINTQQITSNLPDHTLTQLNKHLAAAKALGMEKVASKGSNNWVVSGQHTKSGQPLLADDPHLGLSSPMLWYLADIQGDKIKTIGATIPGLGPIVIGRNQRIAWGVTNLDTDVQDLYIEPPNTSLTSRKEVIKVKDESDVVITVRESKHGPIISDHGTGSELGPLIALKWTSLQPGDTTYNAYVELNYAQNWPEFTQALSYYVSPSMNFVYADLDGNIGYYGPGKIPIRKGWDGSLPVIGNGNYEWQGYIPHAQLPHTYNPKDGMIISANNKVVSDRYPYSLGNSRLWAEPYRAERIEKLLKQKKNLTVKDFKRIQYDHTSPIWEKFKPFLLETTPKDDFSRQAIDKLRNWDGLMSIELVEPLIFEAWLAELRKMAQDELDTSIAIKSLTVLEHLKSNDELCKNIKTKKISSCRELQSESLHTALQKLTQQLGHQMNQWHYGALHQTYSKHRALGDVQPINSFFNHQAPSVGGTNTINVAQPRIPNLEQTHGATYRQIIDFSDLNKSVYVGSLGQSGSPWGHYALDQQTLWLSGKYIPMSTDSKDWGKTQKLSLRPD